MKEKSIEHYKKNVSRWFKKNTGYWSYETDCLVGCFVIGGGTFVCMICLFFQKKKEKLQLFLNRLQEYRQGYRKIISTIINKI